MQFVGIRILMYCDNATDCSSESLAKRTELELGQWYGYYLGKSMAMGYVFCLNFVM